MTLDLTKTLISCESVTPNDDGCQRIISDRLKQLNFHIENMVFGEVQNLWARHGNKSPLMVFAGHTDVVPPGPLDAWQTPPFAPDIRDGWLFGRGAADMKSGLAAMVIAAENFLRKNPEYSGSIAFLITSDEEGPSINGTKRVVETLSNRQEKMDYCVIGEASSDQTLGDQIRVGRRGSLHGNLKILGKQGHVAFPEKALNPIHAIAPALKDFAEKKWDEGNAYFPATTFQISNIHSGTGAANVIPGTLEITFNFRFGTASSVQSLQKQFTDILHKYDLDYELEWDLSGEPFLTPQGKLIDCVKASIKEITGVDTALSTGGGTSDGRFIAPTGTEVIELGPCNQTIHQVNECVKVEDLDRLTDIYERILEKIYL